MSEENLFCRCWNSDVGFCVLSRSIWVGLLSDLKMKRVETWFRKLEGAVQCLEEVVGEDVHLFCGRDVLG